MKRDGKHYIRKNVQNALGPEKVFLNNMNKQYEAGRIYERARVYKMAEIIEKAGSGDMAWVIFKNSGYNWHLWSCGRNI